MGNYFVKSAMLSALTSTLDRSSRNMHVSSVNRSKAPVSLVASPVQLVLNLFDVRCVACSECHIIDNDREQQVNECVSRDVHQFSEHRAPLERMKFDVHSRNPSAKKRGVASR